MRFLGILVAGVLLQTALVACGGSDNKPPLTPDNAGDMTADAGDVPADPAAVQAAAPSAP
ncbi:MAG TPA: hypothetical protein VF407_06160 [Polyangiaceae bacterium]